MPEISKERLTELEMLEKVVKHYVLPAAIRCSRDAENEERWIGNTPLELSDEQVEEMMQGIGMWDHPPQGWGKKRLAHWSRGYLMGRLVATMNFGQDFTFILDILTNPAQSWQDYYLDKRSLSQKIADEKESNVTESDV